MSSSSIPNLVPPVRGTADLATLLRLITDSSFQKDVAKYLTDMEEGRKLLNETIAAYGKVQDLDDLISQAKVDAASAEKVLAEAEAKAQKLLAETHEVIVRDNQEIQNEKEKLDARRKLMNRDESSHREDMRNREEALLREKKDLAVQVARVAKESEDVAALKEKYNLAIEKLKAAGVTI